MAIAFDTSTNAVLATESTKTFSHTVTGSAPIIFVHIEGNNDISVSAISYNSIPLTQGKREAGSGGTRWNETWFLKGPVTGAHNVDITLSGATDGGIVASSYTGVDQTTPLGTWVSVGNSGGGTSIDVSSAVDELVVDFDGISGNTAITPGGGQTQRYDYYSGSERLYSSTKSGATTVTMTWTDGGQYTNHVGVSMKPSIAITPMFGGSVM